MSNTSLSIQGEAFLINGQLTYSEISGSNPAAHGLLMNARFIQGIFDDKADVSRYNRFGRGEFNPGRHTDDLLSALPEWYAVGLRAFTVGFQGGGPFYTIDNHTIDNNPFGEDGTTLDPAYAERLDRLIHGADALGMVVIVSYFYGVQAQKLRDGRAVRNAVQTASNFLRDGGYRNVIIEVANEHDIPAFTQHPLIYYPEGVAVLLDLARRESGGLPVGCSGKGASVAREIAEASDIILIHGNGCTRQQLYNLIGKARGWELNRPIVCNEDSQAIGQMAVTFPAYTSWGYYNNMTKQEPPADWGITKGEDEFFARRMAAGIGIDMPPMPIEDQYYLQGLEPEMTYGGQRWIRLASLYPETINFVEFFRNREHYDICYDEPFLVHFQSNWQQRAVTPQSDEEAWTAVIHLRNGDIIKR
jgi:hypothetical protein